MTTLSKDVRFFIRSCETLFDPRVRSILTAEDVGVIQLDIRDLAERFGKPSGKEKGI